MRDEVREEEHRLQEERRREEAAVAAAAAAAAEDSPEAPLSDGRFKQLDALLDRTTMYSKFLAEQLVSSTEAVKGGGGGGGVMEGAGGLPRRALPGVD